MDDIMEILRAARAARGPKGPKGPKPPVATIPDPLVPLVPLVPGPIPVAHRDAHRDARPVTLHGPIPWDQQEVSRRTRAADELVVHLHVDGRHPEVQRAAAMVVSATATRDMEVLVYAITEFNLTARRVAKRSAPNTKEKPRD